MGVAYFEWDYSIIKNVIIRRFRCAFASCTGI
jgi:hypothetical protein